MTTAVSGNAARVSRRQVDKFGARRDELAAAALQTLAELGYARTSLREIAQNSAFSHGVLHYYFSDKVDLITHCVKQYKVHCVQRYDDIIAQATTPGELTDGFAAAMADTAAQDGPLHRLWYDMRSQSMYEEAFRADVLDIDDALRAMIWRVIDRYSYLAEQLPAVTPTAAYAIFDGLFQRALLRHLSGHTDALDDLATEIRSLLPNLFRQVRNSVSRTEDEFRAELWEWRGPAPFYWVTLPEHSCAYVRSESAEASYGWGAVPVRARIGATEWETSLLPKSGGYVLPVKREVRTRERCGAGDTVTVAVSVAPRGGREANGTGPTC